MKKLCKKLITLTLSISMFFGTGITNVFAFNLSTDEIVLDNTISQDVDVVKQVIDIYDSLYKSNSIKSIKGEIDLFQNTELSSNVDTIINNKIENVKEIVPEYESLPDLVLTSGNKIRFINGTFDPSMEYYDSNDSQINDLILINQINIEAVNLLKGYKTEIIEPLKQYLTEILEMLTIDDSIDKLVNDIKNDYSENFATILNYIDFTNVTYGTDIDNPILDLDNSIDIDSITDLVISDIITNNLSNFESYLNKFIELNSKIKLFSNAKTKFLEKNDMTTMTNIQNFINSSINKQVKLFDVTDTANLYVALPNFYTNLNNNLNSLLQNLESEYNLIDISYTDDINRLTANNALDEFLLNKLFTVSTIVNSTKTINENYSLFSAEFLSEYDRSKLSVDNNLASLKINNNVLDLTKEYQEIYVESDITDALVEVLTNSNMATFTIVKPNELVSGSNIIRIIVTSEAGISKTYTINVIRKEKVEVIEKTVVSKLSNTTNNKISDESSDKVELDDSSDSSKKYDENEIEEEGLSGWAILLIVVGIGLIGFGVYLLFGDRKSTPVVIKKESIKSIKKPDNKSINQKKKNKK